MKKFILISILIFLNSVICFSQEKSIDRIKLTELIVEFEASIIKKDSVRFKKIFFNEATPFVGVMANETEMSIKKDYPDFQGVSVSNASKFIKEICESEKKQVEKFYNINIESDGPIANISFDYSFLSDDKIFQWGNEKWNLVFVEKQWLITDVVYSINFPDIAPFPYQSEMEK